MAALARPAGFLLLALLLACAWTHPPAHAPGPSAQAPESARHAQGAEEGETPNPIADQELALKKRRDQPVAPAQSVAAVSRTHGVKGFTTTVDPDPRQLDMAAQRASQRYALASRLRLRDPAIRLHPGHAPPRYPSIAAG